MDKIRISAVSYLNTLPFLYGIKQSNLLPYIEFELDYPSICASKLIDNKVDLALIPVASIPLVHDARIISDYCIGANNEVKSVLLLSDVSLNQIESVLLDYQSRTSVNLIKVLAGKLWNITPEWIQAEKDFENKIAGKVAGVVIGDRTFSLQKKYKFAFDLSAEWFKLTGLPFVFAAWVSNKTLAPEFIRNFNEALKFGIANINKVVDSFNKEHPNSEIELYNYLTKNISFKFDSDKKKSLKLFYQYLIELQLIPKDSINFSL